MHVGHKKNIFLCFAQRYYFISYIDPSITLFLIYM